MASPTVNVVRWTALISGVLYGVVHHSTLQAKYDEGKAHKHHATRAELVEKAREAWKAKVAAGKGGANAAELDPESPKFDLEKLFESLDKSS